MDLHDVNIMWYTAGSMILDISGAWPEPEYFGQELITQRRFLGIFQAEDHAIDVNVQEQTCTEHRHYVG